MANLRKAGVASLLYRLSRDGYAMTCETNMPTCVYIYRFIQLHNHVSYSLNS